MPDRLEELQARLAELTQRLEGVARRLARLEQTGDASATPSRPAGALAAEEAVPELPALPGGIVSLLGRTLIVLGGAYLFRAVTDAGVLPAAGGVAAGLAYAAWWLVSADRAAAAGQRTSAVFHGLVSGLIAYPLVWETTSRFRLIGPGTGIVLLLACFALGLGVAWRRLLAPIAWVAALLALVTTFGILVATHHLVAASAGFLGVAAGVDLTARRDRWLGLRWPAALAADAALVVLLDIAMPRLGGFEAAIEIKKIEPDVKILVLTQSDDKEFISRFLKAGVSGYLLKRAVGSDLVSAIHAVQKGETYLYPPIATKVVNGFLGKGELSQESSYDRLTDREKQILKLVAEGHPHKEIADMLNISAKTVIVHQTNVFEKLGFNNRSELIKYAMSHGIIKIDK